jgi:2-phospho-L-lactate guanylyltransferase
VNWTALVPLKPSGERKTRLAGRLSSVTRAELGQAMFEHVTAAIGKSPLVVRIILVSDSPVKGWSGGWHHDQGRGLNAELMAARAAIGGVPLLVMHADLPLASTSDVEALLDAATQAGCAIAPDRHGAGTNALAIHDGRDFDFRFGPDSFSRHLAQTGGQGRVVERPGLALDVDTSDDLDAAIAAGFSL